MERGWTFNQKVSFGFAAMVAIAVALSAVAVLSLRSVVREKDYVINVTSQLQDMGEKLLASNQTRLASLRGFMISRDEEFLTEMKEALSEDQKISGKIRGLAQSAEERDLVDKIDAASLALRESHDQVVAKIRGGTKSESLSSFFKSDVAPKADASEAAVRNFIQKEESLGEDARRASTEAATGAIHLLYEIGIFGGAVAVVLAFFLSHTLGKQIGSAVQHIQSSSGELQAAASQQTSGTREQVTSMNEISTTIKELLSTSKQIAESAQRVAEIAENTAAAAKNGGLTVERAQEGIQTIKKQVDVIVNHMLDLGRKSQQAGGILEVINELAEQTNILAINATIEAAGAGEIGKRFVVVADEIRKLADRVGGSTKDIRTLVDEIRSAVNTTVMATETGAKSVDAGTKQFGEVTLAFKEIAGMVGTSRDAAREIELSTKQQSSSVEQVSSAISNIAQTAKESEASSTQTLQTVSELTTLSRALAQLVQSRA